MYLKHRYEVRRAEASVRWNVHRQIIDSTLFPVYVDFSRVVRFIPVPMAEMVMLVAEEL